tara:strand:- start:6 stop:200 length:195 start_codon:yes stop_codon:yes gene_type:complete
MNDEKIRDGLRLLLHVWERYGQEGIEALLKRKEDKPREYEEDEDDDGIPSEAYAYEERAMYGDD